MYTRSSPEVFFSASPMAATIRCSSSWLMNSLCFINHQLSLAPPPPKSPPPPLKPPPESPPPPPPDHPPPPPPLPKNIGHAPQLERPHPPYAVAPNARRT